MGIMNYTLNRLLERKDIFADFVNGTLFQGREVIHDNNLTLLSPNSGLIQKDVTGKKRAVEQRGDVHMQADEAYFSVIVVTEPQATVDYTMVIRIMEYVVMKYKKQIEDKRKGNRQNGIPLTGAERFSGIRKEEKLMPVAAIVFYCGEEEWDGSKCLYDMLDWTEESADVAEMKQYIPDFQLNIVKAQNVENVEKFKTSLQLIFGMLKCGKDKERLYDFMEAHEDELTHLDDVEAEALLALLGQMQIVEERLNSKKAKEAINVCKAIRDMIADGEMRGEKKGIDLGMLLISRLLEAGRIDDVKRVAVDTEFRDLLFAEFGLS